MLKILGKRVLIKKFSKSEDLIEKTKKLGIELPEQSLKDFRNAVEKGEIIETGLDDWKKTIGQKVYFNSWAGDEIEFEGNKYIITHIDDILAIYK